MNLNRNLQITTKVSTHQNTLLNQNTRSQNTSSQNTYYKQLHEKALSIAKNYHRCEIELIDIIEKVDKHKIFYTFGYSSLYSYVSDYLGLSKDVAAIFINVARKTREVPALKEEIKNGTLSVSKARRMTAVLTVENQEHWLHLAKTQSKAILEKEVAKVNPKLAVLTKAQFVHASVEVKEKASIKKIDQVVRVQLQLGVSEKIMIKLRRAQDILSQKMKQSVDLEQTLDVMLDTYLEKEDPVKKAERQFIRGKVKKIKSVPGHNIEKEGLDQNAEKANPETRDLTTEQFKQDVQVQTSKEVNQEARVQITTQSINQIASQSISQNTHDNTKQQKRIPFAASIKHQVNLKYQGRCGHTDKQGKRCSQSRFLEIHHMKPVSQGGSNDIDNLILYCHGHHKMEHLVLENRV